MSALPTEAILYLSEADVRRACQDIKTVELMRTLYNLHHSGDTVVPAEAYLEWQNQRGESCRSLNMPGYLGRGVNRAGTKIINANPRNIERGIPRASGLTLLFDTNSGRIICIMEGAYISALRTASVSALAMDLLHASPVTSLCVVGAGALAAAHIRLFADHFPSLKAVRIFDLEKARAESLCRELAPFLATRAVALVVTGDAKSAVSSSQTVVTATTTSTAYISYDWLQPGATLVNVSLDDALPEVIIRADLLVVDDWRLVKEDSRRLLGKMYREGLVSGLGEPPSATARRSVDADLGMLVSGTARGRKRASDIVVVNPFGLSLDDIIVGSAVYERARDLGLGICLPR